MMSVMNIYNGVVIVRDTTAKNAYRVVSVGDVTIISATNVIHWIKYVTMEIVMQICVRRVQ